MGPPLRTLLRLSAIALAVAVLWACGSNGPAGPTPSTDLVASGTVTDRIAGGQIDGSTITFTGPATRKRDGDERHYRVDGLASGLYTATIDGPRHVQHKTLGVGVYASASSTFSFEVLAWGTIGHIRAGHGKWKRIPPDTIGHRLPVHLDHLERIDVNVKRMLEDIVVHQRPLLHRSRLDDRVVARSVERLAVEEELTGAMVVLPLKTTFRFATTGSPVIDGYAATSFSGSLPSAGAPSLMTVASNSSGIAPPGCP